MLNRSLGELINYHYSNDFLWYSLMFILPLITSIFIAKKIKSKYLTQIGAFLIPTLIIGTLCFGYLNNNQWGYWFKRPSTFTELENTKTIVSISNITKEFDKDNFKIEKKSNVAKDVYGRKDLYYGNVDRPIMVFQDNSSKHPDLLDWHIIATDSSAKINVANLKTLTKTILNSNILFPHNSESYYETANKFNGKVIEFKTIENKSYYYIAMESGEVSNDHYPFYEFLFEKEQPNHILKYQTFFVDIAGIEGFEYANVIGLLDFLFLLSIGIFVALFNKTKMIIHKKDYNTCNRHTSV